VKFKFVEGGLTVKGDKVKGFAVAGKNKVYYWADAKVSGDTVTVSSDKVPEPESIRFGWSNNPEINLFGKNGMPVMPFRLEKRLRNISQFFESAFKSRE